MWKDLFLHDHNPSASIQTKRKNDRTFICVHMYIALIFTISSLVSDLFRLFFYCNHTDIFIILWNIFHSFKALKFINLFIPRYSRYHASTINRFLKYTILSIYRKLQFLVQYTRLNTYLPSLDIKQLKLKLVEVGEIILQ